MFLAAHLVHRLTQVLADMKLVMHDVGVGNRLLDRAADEVIPELNRLLKGWDGYFHYAHSTRVLDRRNQFVAPRMHRWLWHQGGGARNPWTPPPREVLQARWGLYRRPPLGGVETGPGVKARCVHSPRRAGPVGRARHRPVREIRPSGSLRGGAGRSLAACLSIHRLRLLYSALGRWLNRKSVPSGTVEGCWLSTAFLSSLSGLVTGLTCCSQR